MDPTVKAYIDSAVANIESKIRTKYSSDSTSASSAAHVEREEAKKGVYTFDRKTQILSLLCRLSKGHIAEVPGTAKGKTPSRQAGSSKSKSSKAN